MLPDSLKALTGPGKPRGRYSRRMILAMVSTCGSCLRHQHIVFPPHPAVRGVVQPRLNGEDHAGKELGVLVVVLVSHKRRLMHIQADSVAKGMRHFPTCAVKQGIDGRGRSAG